MKRSILLLAIALLAVGAAAQQSDRARHDAIAARAGQRLEELHREAERLASEARTLLGDLRQLELERQIKREEFRKADADAAAAAAALASIESEIRELESENLAEQPELASRITELYKLGEGRYLRLLLTTSDVRHLGEASRMVAALAKRDRDRLEAHQRRIVELAEHRKAAAARSRQLAALRTDAQRAQAAAERAVAERDARVRDIDRRRDLNAQLAGELQLAQQKLQLTLRDTAATPDAASPVATIAAIPLRPFRGALDWPVSGPQVSIRQRFGSRVTGSSPSGVVFGAPEGLTVQVIHDGTVAFADTFAGYGRLVIVDHGAQTFSLYGNLLDLTVEKGALVTAGESLGTVGASVGGEAGLYFELRIDARPVDPLQWLRGSPSRAPRSGF